MSKDEKLFSVQSRLNDQDFDDVFRIYLEMERGNERKIAMITCIVLFVICIVLLIVMKNITFLFYGIGCLIVGFAYLLVPVNKKFLATNRLMFGIARETGFYQHSVTTMEIFSDEDSTEMTEEEVEDATTVFQTGSMTAYENERGFLFAEGKITNQFLYIPKRGLTEEELSQLTDFAKERCSGGYRYLQMKSMIEGEQGDTEQAEESVGDSLVSQVCDRYYGADKLHLHDEEGHAIADEDDTAAEEEKIADNAAEEPAEITEAEETAETEASDE